VKTRRQAAAALVAVTAFASACGGSDDASNPTGNGPVIEDPGPVHVHGLGINQADGALFVATHTGLFQAAPGERRATRVGGRFQDTMGFTVVGPNHFLGSGHPDGRDRLPPFLGLIRTTDAGRSWKPVSLLGKRDFHVLEASGPRIYGYGSDYESRQAGLLVSDDEGRSWQERAVPEPLLSLAIDPQDPDRVLAAGEDAMYRSTDAAQGWRPVSDQAGLLAWTRPGAAYLVTRDGRVSRSRDSGLTWEQVGDIGGQPAAFESSGDDLYAALHDGTVKRSNDEGRIWILRSWP
jgi:hypothetical protein